MYNGTDAMKKEEDNTVLVKAAWDKFMIEVVLLFWFEWNILFWDTATRMRVFQNTTPELFELKLSRSDFQVYTL